jgi:iron complex outermembrane receptor protein
LPRDNLTASSAGLRAHRLHAAPKSSPKVAVNDLNSEFAAGWTIANAALVFVQQGPRWRLSEFVRVDNLFDKQYVGSVIVNEANGRYYERRPRGTGWSGSRRAPVF